MKQRRKKQKGFKAQKGFTLLEMSIVIVVTCLFFSMALPLLHSYLLEGRMKMTQARMQTIETAINTFYRINGRLPCVASLTAPESAASFGAEVGQPPGPDCRAAVAPGAFFQGKGSAGNVVQIGAVPGRTLGLPDGDMVDAWGDNFIYAVTSTLASATIAASAASGAIAPVTTGEIAVVDSKGHSVVTPAGSAQYVLISHGPDGAGAYNDGTPVTPCPAGATESPNCTFPPTKIPVTFVKTLLTGTAGGAGQYDDFVDFYTWIGNNGAMPKNMIMILDGTPCPGTASLTNAAPLWSPPTNPAVVNALDWLGLSAPVIYCEKQY